MTLTAVVPRCAVAMMSVVQIAGNSALLMSYWLYCFLSLLLSYHAFFVACVVDNDVVTNSISNFNDLKTLQAQALLLRRHREFIYESGCSSRLDNSLVSLYHYAVILGGGQSQLC